MNLKQFVLIVLFLSFQTIFNYSKNITLEEKWSYSNEFLNLKAAYIKDNLCYLVDRTDKSVIILEDGKFVKRFGRKGKGPGEFIGPGNILVSESEIIVFDINRSEILYFDLNGNFKIAKTLPLLIEEMSILPNGNYVISHIINIEFKGEKKYKHIAIDLFDKEFNKIRNLNKLKYINAYLPKNKKAYFNLFMYQSVLLVDENGVFIADPENYTITKYSVDFLSREVLYQELEKTRFDKKHYESELSYYADQKIKQADLVLPVYNPLFDKCFLNQGKFYMVKNFSAAKFKIKIIDLETNEVSEFDIQILNHLEQEEILSVDKKGLIYSGYDENAVYYVKRFDFIFLEF